MVSFKSVVKTIVLIISGIAIVVVGGFMMGAVARLWLPKDKKKPKDSDLNENDGTKKAD
ncbi:MAG: hypothetical protein ACREBI_07330 [Nitrosotalea sp.]